MLRVSRTLIRQASAERFDDLTTYKGNIWALLINNPLSVVSFLSCHPMNEDSGSNSGASFERLYIF